MLLFCHCRLETLLVVVVLVLVLVLVARDRCPASHAPMASRSRACLVSSLELAAAVRRGACQVHASTATAPLRWSAAGCSAEGHGRLEGWMYTHVISAGMYCTGTAAARS